MEETRIPRATELNANVPCFFSYVLFSIGNIKPLFESVFSNCWDTHEVCNKQWISAVEYLEIVGIIVGQILVGFLGDWYVLFYWLFFFSPVIVLT